jgi:hypothetical protein
MCEHANRAGASRAVMEIKKLAISELMRDPTTSAMAEFACTTSGVLW